MDVVQILGSPPTVAVILVIGGFLQVLWGLACFFKRDSKSAKMSMHIISPVIGIVAIVVSISGLIVAAYPKFTSALLLVMGLSMFLPTLKDFPLAIFFSLIVAAGLTLLIWVLLPSSVGGLASWILVGVFLLTLFFVYMILRFIEQILRLISKILCWEPISFTIGIIALIEGGLSLFGVSLVSLT